ncbi:pentapeptide repeat-containing protein [Oleidesulfovibrio alaskensis]
MGCCKCEMYKWDDPQDAIVCDMERREYCLFHAPAELKKRRHEELMNAAWERINCVTEYNVGLPEAEHKVCELSGSIFADDAYFTGLYFRGATYFRHAIFEGEAYFRHTIFEGVADFAYATFGEEANFSDVPFKGKTDFSSATFKREANFSSTSFGGVVSFKYATFEARADFAEAILTGDAYLTKAIFEGDAYFSFATFRAVTSFRYATFGETVDFSNVTFGGMTNFWYTIFREEAYFSEARFGGADKKATTIFSHAILGASGRLHFTPRAITGPFIADKTDFNGRVRFDDTHFKDKVSFGESNLGQVSFNLCKFDQQPIFDRTDLRKAELIGAPVEDFRFMACKWPESKGRKITYDARKINGNGFITIDNVEKIAPFPTQGGSKKPNIPPLKHLEDLYRRLKKVARAEMDEPLASDFHYAEKEMMRLHGFEAFLGRNGSGHGLSLTARFQGLGRYITLSLYRLISGYGEAPLRALWTLCMLLFTPYMLLEPTNNMVALWFVGIAFLFSQAWYIAPLLLALVLQHMSQGVLGLHELPVEIGRTALDKWINFLPLTKLDSSIPAVPRILMLAWQVAITLQAALFGFALRNRFRR